jgi:perosamine synthetase
MQDLFEAGVATRPGTHAPHLLGYYREKYKIEPDDYPQSRRADLLTLALPLYSGLTGAEQERACTQVGELWPKTR